MQLSEKNIMSFLSKNNLTSKLIRQTQIPRTTLTFTAPYTHIKGYPKLS